MVRYFLSQIENGHKSDSETHGWRDKPDKRATENWLETNNYDWYVQKEKECHKHSETTGQGNDALL